MNINRRADLIQNIAPLVVFLTTMAGILAIDWSNDETIRDLSMIDANYEVEIFNMVRNDIREVHLKIREINLQNQRPE